MPVLDPTSAPKTVVDCLERIRGPVHADMDERLRLPDLPEADPAHRLARAMRYAALSPGKRLRPAFAIAACEALGGTLEQALPAASAVELLHAYTLVHDDLPAMDDDDVRRGRPTVHIEFDEATAVLAGDGLLTKAFESLADLEAGASAAIRVMAERTGVFELLAGQALDIATGKTDSSLTLAEIERIHGAKTGALFSAAAELGAIAAGASNGQRASLKRYGQCLGVAFQYADDRDDGELQHIALEANQRRRDLCEEAKTLASTVESSDTLNAFATWIGTAGL